MTAIADVQNRFTVTKIFGFAALALLLFIFAQAAVFAADPPPAPSKTSAVGETVTNPVTGQTTTVNALIQDPAGTPTAGDTAFVQTADGYTFLVKSENETFYNGDTPPVTFTVVSISGGEALVSSPASDGTDLTTGFPVEQTTSRFEDDFFSTGSQGSLEPLVDVVGPDGVKQVAFGQNGNNGRNGALFVPPNSGGKGQDGPAQTVTLSSDVNATSNIGWEVGSVGGNGGKGGNSYLSFFDGRDGGDGGAGGTVNATQTASSTIVTKGDRHYGIFAYSHSGEAGNGGSGFAAPGGGTGGHSADGGSVTVTQQGVISTSGENAHGIYALSVSNNGGDGGDQWGLVGSSGDGGFGGDGGTVVVNTESGATILTNKDFSVGILAQSIGGSGGSAGASGNLLVSLIGSADNGGDGGAVTVNNGGAIETHGTGSRGIFAQSIGGGGGQGGTAGGLIALALGGVGSNGGNGGIVSVTNTGTGSILTLGESSDGIMAQSIGGSGGDGANSFGLVSIGGDGSKGGSAAAVSVTNEGVIETRGNDSVGIIAQSLGGGGGDGGSSRGMVAVGGGGAGGGNGDVVTVVNDGVIKTKGNDSLGILAQSIGGGGGNGGSSGAIGAFAGVAVGGDGGKGGQGGNVDIVLSDEDTSQPSQIVTEGDRSTAVFAQSIGGGGGNGGGAVSVALGFGGAAAVAVGGQGGDGGDGGVVTLNGVGDVAIQTGGEDAAGIVMQSIGGGGGNGGYAISTAVSGGPFAASLGVSVGGSGSTGGEGGAVTVGTVDGSGNLLAPGISGSVLTQKGRSAGMIFQSIGGGGGNGGLSVAVSAAASMTISGNLSVSVGGSGGGGGDGGEVKAYTDADIATLGNSSTALLVESVGGGGGNGGGSVAAGGSGGFGGAGSINVGVGGSGGTASQGGAVTLIAGGDNIYTEGQFSSGVIAQSIGGGGGNGGYAIGAGGAAGGGVAGAVNVAVGGTAGGGGDGGSVAATVRADVATYGADSGAVLIQSVGGGGGNGGYAVAAGAAGAGTGAGTVSVGLGGSGGSGGEGGAVDAAVEGEVYTESDRSSGVVAQSIGGGGGNGGFDVSGGIAGAGVGSGSVSVGLGGSGGSGGNGGSVNATVSDRVTTDGNDSTAVLAQSVGGGGGNGGFNVSAAVNGGGTGAGAVSVGLGGDGGSAGEGSAVTLVSDGNIQTSGERSSGFVAQSIGGGGGNGGFNVAGSVTGAGTGSGSVNVGLGGSGSGGGNGGTVNATSNGTILTQSYGSSGFVAQSIGGGGGNGAFNVSAGVALAGTGAGSVSVGLGGSGAGGGAGGAVTAKTTANIETKADASTGILAQSVGGGGGNGAFNIAPAIAGAGTGSGAISVGLGGSGAGGGNGGSVDLTVENDVLTHGADSAAIIAQSIGGGGGNGSYNVTVSGAGAGTGAGTIGVGLGGRGGAGGDGDAVTADVTGNVATEGENSGGLLVQSLGGGGGNGGMNVSASVAVAGTGSAGAAVGLGGAGGDGGKGGTAFGTLDGDISTSGNQSSAFMVQSLGGGGGNGGINVSGTITAAGTGSGGVAVGIGGSGGGGGRADTATGELTGNIVTLGTDSAGFFVQSLGGGGGNGGLNVSGGISASRSGSGALGVGIGGFGGDGGRAGAATGTVTGDVYTAGDRSGGIMIQSLGGGGGNGGVNVTGTVALSSQNSGAIGVGIGGFGGSGGDADTATGTVTGDVTTEGDDATAVLVQSLGGGGGNGGMNVTGALGIAGTGSGAVAVGVGGFGGDGGAASDVTASYDGKAMTVGDRSNGIVAQSLGGGGGNGGVNVSAGLTIAKELSGSLGLGIGGFGGGGGNAGSVDHTVAGYVETQGDDSVGILTQSLGGGGGNGGLTVDGAVSISRQTSAAVALGVGGFGGTAANAGALTQSDIAAGVVTYGNNAMGILTQSLGGAGGNGGTTVSGALDLSQQRGGSAALGVGGFGGGGGNGGTVVSKVRTSDIYDAITTIGDDSTAVMAQSIGGGGGNGGLNVSGSASLTGQNGAAVALGVGGFGGSGGDGGDVSLDVAGTINTYGDGSTGIMAQSLGGGGGTGGTNVAGTLSLTKPGGLDTIFSVSAGVGGFGGGGGDAGNVDVDFSGLLTALPRTINADNTVTLDLTGAADGLVAQSIGGGGGSGGVNVSAGVAISTKPGEGRADESSSAAVVVGVGGFGGTGGNAGMVSVDVVDDSTIVTHGIGRSGILAQSVGGGGGNGGMNVSGGLVSDTALIVGVGGFGGNAGTGDDVTVLADADIFVTTDPADIEEPSDESFEQKLRDTLGATATDFIESQVDTFGLKSLMVDLGLFEDDDVVPETEGSAGILAQSIGGAGGNGGLNVSGGVAITKDGQTPSITFGVGGFGGAGNVSGDVSVDQSGTIAVEGNWKHGILAQSIAGGGGNGALNVTGQLNFSESDNSSGATDLSIVAGLGGHGGVGADAGNVDVVSSGDISTNGYHARGILAQSVGGGGGTGGINVSAVVTKDSTPVGIGIGGSGDAGGDAGDVTVARGTSVQKVGRIVTDGIGAHGIEASSIGGGGGDAGINALLGASKTTGSGTSADKKNPVADGVDPSVTSDITSQIANTEGKTDTGPNASSKSVNSAVIAVGGSAGNAGNGGKAEISNFSDVFTFGNESHGVFAQSIGGGGGNASFNGAYVYENGNADDNRGFGLAVGGGTGEGGTGGDVTITNSGAVGTSGDDSHGIFAQSIGGGGGNAGYNMLNTGGKDGKIGITIGRFGGTGGSAGDVTVKSDSQIVTEGQRSNGVFAQSIGNGGGNSTAVSVSVQSPKKADGDANAVSIKLGLEGGEGGTAGDVNVEASGSIGTKGDDSHGIFAQSVGGGGGNGGGALGQAGKVTSYAINVGGTGGTGGAGGAVDVTSSADIATFGDRAIGILAQSIGGGGGTGGYAKSGVTPGGAAVAATFGEAVGASSSLNVGGTGGAGMVSGSVIVDNGGIITTEGDFAHGILATSIGGGGGLGGLVENNIFSITKTISSSTTLSIGGEGGTGAVSGIVDVTNAGQIGTNGFQSAGIFAQSVGGGGGDAQHTRNIVIGSAGDNAVQSNALLIGGTGGTGAAGSTVTVSNLEDGLIITEGDEGHGIFAQSVGGGGGNGGEVLSIIMDTSGRVFDAFANLQLGIGGSGTDGGIGGTVSVTNDGQIITRGNKAHGILAQSIGGGGGNGGQSMTGDLTLRDGDERDPTLALNIGGSGGSGNAAGKVSVINNGTIDVSGAQSYGIFAQSVGGGGGNGGLAAAAARSGIENQIKGSTYNRIAVGGAGGDGADGGDVTVANTGTIFVRGDNSYGILAQSVGGGGGNAGFSISTPAVMVADYVISSALGARTGSGGVAGVVSVDNTGDIFVTGVGSQAVLSQSINGGGGNVDTFLDFANSGEAIDPATASVFDPIVSLQNQIALGGQAVSDAIGADIFQTYDGQVITTEERSSGFVTQTIGGGGGTSTTTVNASESANMSVAAMLGAIDTNNSGGGDIVFERSGTIITEGAQSTASLSQSIGGGGGRLVIVGGDGAGQRDASVILGADPSFNNPGGNIALTLNGDVSTLGDNSSAQIVQSIGAGGGEAYLTGLDQATVTIGATDGSTGDGGAITVVNVGGTSTAGARAHGFVLQSIGGGGGLISTDLDAADVNVVLSDFNGGNGGDISFANIGYVVTSGDESIGILAQSLGGGGGSVDSLFHGSAGGVGNGGDVSLEQTGNVLSTGSRGIAVLAQSLGTDGAGAIDIALDGVVVGGSDVDGSTDTAAIVMAGGTFNTLSLSSGSFLSSANNRILIGGSGSEAVTLDGKAVGNIDLGGGLNTMLVSEGASFWAQDEVDLGATGTLTVDGNLYLGGAAYLSSTTLGVDTLASDLSVTENVIQTTSVNGSLVLGDTATYTPDVSFAANGTSSSASDVITVTGDATISGTIYPVLNALGGTQPINLIAAGGSVANNGVTIVGTPVVGYEIGLVDLPGGLSAIELIAKADFRMTGMNRNQTLTADHINRVLAGQGSDEMGNMFGLIANMQTSDDVISAVNSLSSYDYATTQIDALYSGYRFAQTLADCGPSNFDARFGDDRGCTWVSGSAGRLNGKASFEYQSYEAKDAGFSTGIQMPLNDNGLYMGAGAGFESFSIASGNNFTADGNRGQVGASLSQYIGDWRTYGVVSGSLSHYNSTRYIDIAGALPNGDVVIGGTGRADQRVGQAGFRVGTAYRFDDFSTSFYLEPGLHFDAAFLHSSDASESGTQYGLELKDTNQWLLSATPSFEVGFEAQAGAAMRMQAFLLGAVSFSNADSVYINSTFAGASIADGVFRNYSQIGQVTGKLNAGVTFSNNDNSAAITLGYQGMWSDDTVSNTATVDFGFRF